jgi:hypothetical protein
VKLDIYAKKGDKVRFLNKNGYDSQLEHARKHLKENELYTVVKTEVGGWMSYVYLEEVENHSFNTAHFEDATPEVKQEAESINTSPTADYIMSLQVGNELNILIDKSITEHSKDPFQPWSTDTLATVRLWDIIEEHIGDVGIVRIGTDAPNIISQIATVGVEEKTAVYTGNWIESLCKAYLLHEYGFYGDYLHPEFKRKMDNAPKRILQ